MPTLLAMREGSGGRVPVSQDVPWLSADDQASWRAVMRLVAKLPRALDRQLRRDAGLSLVEYEALAFLAEEEARSMRLSHLAEATTTSLSRLSQLMTRLEQRGLAYRQQDPEDGRFTQALLTDDGYRKVVEAAPGHATAVRALVVDALGPDRLRRLGEDAGEIVRRIDTSPS
jgi:DNA-binding MarR family transcriptional regulator